MEKHLDRQDKNMALQTDVLMKTIEAFRAEMRSEFAILRSICSWRFRRGLLR